MNEAVSRRSAMRLIGAAGVVGGALGAGACAPTVPPGAGLRSTAPAAPADAEPGGANRIDALLERLTLDEKTALLHGARDPASLGQAGYLPGVPRLGIPALRLADGSAGVRVTETATALPAPVLLASAFDPALAREYGRVVGREGRALGQDVVLSPMANLIRTPYAGRNFEAFAEDPRLTADLVGEMVRGIQEEGLIATVKHFALNNQEHGRDTVDVIAAEQTLHETELRGFEAAVAAGAGAVMGAYNRVNGVHACENKPLLDELLRGSWGFDGWVMSDWDAAHSTVAAIGAGLDMEMPGGTHFGRPLREAVRGGTVPEAAVDLAVHRILTTMDRFGLLAARPAARPPRNAAAGARVARKVAAAGAVLLRNEHGTLPLSGAAARSIAVIGPTGQVPFVGGGGSAHVVPDGAPAPLSAIRQRAGNGSTVRYALGEDLYGRPLPATLLTPAADLDHRVVAPGRGWRHEGEFRLAADDEWTLLVHYTGQRPGVRLDGEELFPVRQGITEHYAGGLLGSAPDGMAVRRRTLALKAGTHRLAVTAAGGDKGQRFRLRHITGAIRAADLAEAVKTAKSARSVVLFAYEDATEGRDRTSLALPGGQERLIEAVAAANPRTTVVLNTSSGTTMPWLSRTGAVLQMYYPGQEGAGATADLLFGDVDPGAGSPRPSRPTSGRRRSAATRGATRAWAAARSTPRGSTSATAGTTPSTSPRCSRSGTGSRTRPGTTRGSPSGRAAPVDNGAHCGWSSPSATPAAARAPKWPRCTSARPPSCSSTSRCARSPATGGSPWHRARRSGSPSTSTPGPCRPGTPSGTPGCWAPAAGRSSRAVRRATCR